MVGIILKASLTGVVAGASLVLAGCEAPPGASAPPDFIKHAMAGEYDAQARLAGCYAETSSCIAIRPDPALECAWRAVIAASQRPELSLADAEALQLACKPRDETFRQRAAIAEQDLLRRIYRGGVSAPADLDTALDRRSLLYPAPETVRRRVSAALAAQREHPLPRFGAAVLAGRDLQWRSCSDATCLEVSSPSFGGGVISYRVVVKRPDGLASAARLAVAGLEAPGLASDISSGPAGFRGSRRIDIGPVCWTAAVANDRATSVGAEPGPCPRS